MYDLPIADYSQLPLLRPLCRLWIAHWIPYLFPQGESERREHLVNSEGLILPMSYFSKPDTVSSSAACISFDKKCELNCVEGAVAVRNLFKRVARRVL